MTRRPSKKAPPLQNDIMTDDQLFKGIDRLKKRLAEVQAFEPTSVRDQYNIPQVDALSAAVDEALVRTFGSNTVDYNRYSDAAHFDNGPFNSFGVSIHEVHASLKRSKERSIALLEQAIKVLNERHEERSVISPQLHPDQSREYSRKVFVVHGHDEGMREAVARFLEKLEIEPLILHEQANQGRTIIEKIEGNSDVGFAVVLLSPDDQGAKSGESPQPRARQNVILELGYFIGRLGRDRVCALKSGDLEIPSDFGGVVYTLYDPNGGWRQALAQELSEAGFDIDWNLVMKKLLRT